MISFKLLSYRNGITSELPHFFILNKGYNSGKPLINPCPNCFMVICANDEEKQILFNLVFMLFKAKKFYSIHKGSVIVFIAIKEVSSLIKEAVKSYQNNKTEFEKSSKLISIISEREKQILEELNKLKLIEQSLCNLFKIQI